MSATNQQLKQLPIPPQTRDYHSRYRNISVLILLPLLALLIIMGGDVNQQLFNGIHRSKATEAVSGPFIQMPLDTTQINALGHLMDHMQYKQLAKMYVSRMTLDEKLGQLFMVQSYDQYYSPALEMMVDQLHAGGVIMYAFQMQTFQQTRHDIL